ncbi:stalk domain-containing protein [Paenibacillus lentus]|nr:stalk domain-containing protein [Paenibacillus lentus]
MKRGKFGRCRAALAGILLSLIMLVPPTAQATPPEQMPSQKGKWLSDVVAISAGDYAVYAIKKDGTAWAWGGMRDRGILGNGSFIPVKTPVRMHIDEVKDIAGGSMHTLILRKDGTVWATGDNSDGQLGIGATSDQPVLEPVQVTDLVNIVAISASGNQSLALGADGTVWQWGRRNSVHTPSSVPAKLEGIPAIQAIAASHLTVSALDKDGQVWITGSAVTNMNPDPQWEPTTVQGDAMGKAIAIATGSQKAAALLDDGTVVIWKNSKVYPTAGDLLTPTKVKPADQLTRLEGGSLMMFSSIKQDGTVWVWDTFLDETEYTAVQVEGITNAIDLANTSMREQYALLSNGTVMKWNYYGGSSKPSKPQLVEDSIRVEINGDKLDFTYPPTLVNNVSYVPLRGVFEHLGAKVTWMNQMNTVHVSKGSMKVVINLHTLDTTINGKKVADNLKPFNENYTTMVPLRFIAEALGAKVNWSNEQHRVRIELPNP